MRYGLRTLLVLMAMGPPLLAAGYFLWLKPEPRPPRASGPVIYEARFDGNRRHADVKFRRLIRVREGMRLNPVTAEEARQKIVALHHRDGYRQVDVRVAEGGKLGDKALTFQIREGDQMRPFRANE